MSTDLVSVKQQIDQLNQTAWDLRRSNPEQALEFVLQSRRQSQELDYKEGLAASWTIAANLHWRLGIYDDALTEARLGLDQSRKLGDLVGEAKNLTTFATVYTDLCDYKVAIDYFLKTANIYEQNGDSKMLAQMFGNVAVVHLRLEQYDQALQYLQRALAIIDMLSEADKAQAADIQANLLNGISDCYLRLHEYDQALPYLQRAQEVAIASNNQYELSLIYTNFGETYTALHQRDKVLDYLQQALEISKTTDKNAVCGVLLHMGNFYAEGEEYEQAINYYKQALENAYEGSRRDIAYQVHLALTKVYKATGDFVNALAQHELYAQLRTEVLNSENQKVIAATQARFQVEQAEREKEIFRLRNVELAEANHEITRLAEQLKDENVRLSAELEVTRRLQRMILPSTKELRVLQNYLDIATFMLPADEVGGDYYDVLRQEDGRLHISIGDVTGHGLESGVVMLMVQTAMRNLIDNNMATDSNQLLAAVNRTIYNNVQRMNSDKSLTLVLLEYIPQEQLLRISGQHETVILVHSNNGSEESIDTMDLGFPVGLVDDIADFIGMTERRIEKGDVVVLYTDGITEASNMQREQYEVERLCQIIQANYEKSAEQIKQAIIDDVMVYIGDQEIFDDITLVVIKSL
jgi:serine phosphatase RsbU (regulator of sigma subunit)